MQQRLPLLARKRRVGVRKDESDRAEEVGFAGAVAADEEVEAGAGEGKGRRRVVGRRGREVSAR